MIRSKDFDAIRVKNSDTEFVVVARGLSGFVPVIASENCSVDLMGFSASKGSVRKGMRDRQRFEYNGIQSDIAQYHQVEVDLAEGPDSSVYFYWKGAMPDDEESFLHECKISLRQLFEERDSWENAPQEFFAWNLGPIVYQIERENLYRAFAKKRYQQNRKRSDAFFIMFAALGTVMVTFVAVGLAGDGLDTLRSLLVKP